MNTRPPIPIPASIPKTSKTQHTYEEGTRESRGTLPDDEDDDDDDDDGVPNTPFPDPQAEDLATLAVDREWIGSLRAAARGFAPGLSVRY